MNGKRVLIIYYSFSSQTHMLVNRFASGMTDAGIEVVIERLQPIVKLPFPFASITSLLWSMTTSFFRKRVAVAELANTPDKNWDLVVLGGPTWSYNPSGPILYFLDHYGIEHFAGKDVLPIISCRAYWRINYSYLKKKLTEGDARVREPLVFDHSSTEPWRTAGLLLQLLGKLPRGDSSWFRKRYSRYGHSLDQFENARALGEAVAAELKGDNS